MNISFKTNINLANVVHNKGWFATEAALNSAYPTANNGDYAIVGTTDTVWVWDGDTAAWVDSSSGGLVDSVFGRTGVIVAATNDYTWAQIDKTVSDIADITTKSHTSLSDIGVKTHATLDSEVGANNAKISYTDAVAVGLNTSHRGVVTGNPHAVTKAEVGLANVENTALSTWVGSANITTLGTITSGNVEAITAGHVLMAGRATPQTIALGTAASAATGYLTSTVHATKGKYFLNEAGTIAIDDLNVRVGIGIASPTKPLEVIGAAKFGSATKPFIVNDDGTVEQRTTSGAWDNQIKFYGNDGVGGESLMAAFGVSGTDNTFENFYVGNSAVDNWMFYRGGASPIFTFNEGGNDVNLKVETVLDADAFFVEGSSGDVGFGSSNPQTKCDIISDSNENALRIRGPGANEKVNIFVGSGGSMVLSTIGLGTGGIDLRGQNADYGIIIRDSTGTVTTSYSNMYLVDGGASPDYLSTMISNTKSTTGVTSLNVTQDNEVGIGGLPANQGKLFVEQEVVDAAKPVLALQQLDVSEEFIDFIAAIGTGNALEVVAAKTFTPTHFAKVQINGSLKYMQIGDIA